MRFFVGASEMTADMVIRFFENYGIVMTLLATSGIIFVGFLKATKLFSKIPDKLKKYVYFGVACVASIVACTIYMVVKKMFEWTDWGVMCACVIGYTMALYAIYENTGIRELLRKLVFNPSKIGFKKLIEIIVSKRIAKENVEEVVKVVGGDIIGEILNASTSNDVNFAEGEICSDIDESAIKETNAQVNEKFFG